MLGFGIRHWAGSGIEKLMYFVANSAAELLHSIHLQT